jgi:Aspartyl protease
MRTFIAITLAAYLLQSVAHSQASENLKTLYEKHHWFALRDVVAQGTAPAFYRAAVEASFDQVKASGTDLGKIIIEAPHSADAYEAHELLATLYFRHGLYREALLQLQAMAKEAPAASDVKNMLPLYTAMGKVDQITVELKPSTLHMISQDGNLYLPVTINRRRATFAFDTGANFNAISDAEARRLGMSVVNVSTTVKDSSGNHVSVRVAVAKDLRIGDLHLRNIAFGVFPDAQPPFNELAERKRGLIGIPVLLAMRTFCWSKDGTFTFGFHAQPFALQMANLAFEQSFPVTRGYFQGKALEMTVDSGAQRTVLSPFFFTKFHDALYAIGKPEIYKLTGVGGSAHYRSLLIPAINLQFSGYAVTLNNAHVLTEKSTDSSNWSDGNLGIDLLNQATSVTFDFKAMTLTLR